MRTTVLCVIAAVAFAVPASAQTKFTGKVHCEKADPDYSIEVGDKAGHMLAANKAACTSDAKVADLTPKGGVAVATSEINGNVAKETGYHTVTMDNGDKYTVRYSGTSTIKPDKSGTLEGKWTFSSGTGKLKGIKGGGTFKGTAKPDGTGDVDIEGEYTLAPATTKPAPAAATKKK